MKVTIVALFLIYVTSINTQAVTLTSVESNSLQSYLYVYGSFYGFGQPVDASFAVVLDTDTISDFALTPNEISFDLPRTYTPGTYKLTITKFSSTGTSSASINVNFSPQTTGSGPVGPTGPTGQAGVTGPTGAIGIQGNNGDRGTKGYTGVTGPTGPSGDKGASGARGAQGAQGAKGPQGKKGDTGSKGAANTYTGPTGITGDTGPKGNTGATGQSGAKGPKGQQGNKGVTGNTGNTGDSGALGYTGSVGDQGPKGPSGPLGNTGDSGNTGNTGETGVAGTKGNTGPTGPSASQFLNSAGQIFGVVTNNPDIPAIPVVPGGKRSLSASYTFVVATKSITSLTSKYYITGTGIFGTSLSSTPTENFNVNLCYQCLDGSSTALNTVTPIYSNDLEIGKKTSSFCAALSGFLDPNVVTYPGGTVSVVFGLCYYNPGSIALDDNTTAQVVYFSF